MSVARKIQSNFEFDHFDTVIWNQGIFRPSRTTIESIEAAAQDFDFAIMLLLPDDLESSRGEIRPPIRDNVLFELGLFTGALGRGRVFMVRPRVAGMKWPTDLLAVAPVEFDPRRFSVEPAAALGTACEEIRTEIARLGARTR
jgi:predicted nucleotide-binding protein